MIHISVMTSFGWWNDGILDTPALFDRLAAHGADGVEVCDADFYGNPDFARNFSAWLAAADLRLIAVDVICNLVHQGPQDRQRARGELRRGLDICVANGAAIAHCAGSQLIAGISPTDGRKMIADLLAEVYEEYTLKFGLTLAIENYGLAPDLICRKADCLEVLARTDNRVKMVFDTGNFFAVNERAEDNLDDCYDQIAMCHFKDWTPASRPPTDTAGAFFENSRLGEGIIANAAIANRLLERGYDGWVSLESCMHSGETVDQTLKRELGLLRRWLNVR